jgi:hypothetical protein
MHKEDKFYCTECNSFVKDRDHRCEQWSNVLRIPKDAIDDILDNSFLQKSASHFQNKFYSMEETNAGLEYKIEKLEKELLESYEAMEQIVGAFKEKVTQSITEKDIMKAHISNSIHALKNIIELQDEYATDLAGEVLYYLREMTDVVGV